MTMPTLYSFPSPVWLALPAEPEEETDPAALFPPEQAARDRAREAARAAERTFLMMFFMGISSNILFGGR